MTLPDSEEKTFSYDGAIDGQERDATSAYSPGKMTVRRVNRFTIESTFHTPDGRYTETASTNSADGARHHAPHASEVARWRRELGRSLR